VQETEREEGPALRRDGREEERIGRVKRGEDREVAAPVYPRFGGNASVAGRMRDAGRRMTRRS
jgi:hypothetical protein